LRQISSVANASKLFVITVPPVRRKWGARLMKSLKAFPVKMLEMPDGEPAKRMATAEKLAETLAESGTDRDAVLLAFGGGVVGDLTGLLASLFMRGVGLVQIPTTVLAQVDASIGGKTGVNLRAGKNLLGTFHPPLVVLIDPSTLSTLPEREFRAGLYESLKAGVIGKPDLFECLEQANVRQLRRDTATLERIIVASVRQKASVVSCDERESDLRRVLNFGHTIGHALESESRYRRFLHGEAVAWGIIAETYIANKLGLCDQHTSERVIAATSAMGPLPSVTAQGRDILGLLQRDKKTRHGVPHFVLPRQIGKVEVVNDVPPRLILEAVRELRAMSRTN